QATQAPREYLKDAATNLKDYADSHLEEVNEELEPVTKHLPEPVRHFLEKGGWWVVFGVLALLALVWLRSVVRRLGGAFAKPRRKKKKHRTKSDAVRLKEDLSGLGEAFTEEGPQQVTVERLPARLRLVILSQGSRSTGELTEEMAGRVLDWMKAGLARATAADFPRVRVWPPFYSAGSFAIAFTGNVPIPEPKGEKSRWVLVSGQVRMGRALLHVGLALYADHETTLRHVPVRGERWQSVLGIRETRQPVGAH